MSGSWTKEELALLAAHYPTSSPEELCALLPGKTRKAIKSRVYVLGLKKEKQRNRITPERLAYLQEHYRNTSTEELAERLRCSPFTIYNWAQKYGLKKDRAFVSETSRKNILNPEHPARKYWIKKGNVPANKGKKQTEYMSAEAIERTKRTRFSKGRRPTGYKPLGYERINADGYIEIKTAEPRKFELKHRVVWRQHRGEIPAGHNVQFRDGNRRNCAIENLYIISRSEQLRNENSIHTRYPEDLKSAVFALGALKRKINELNTK